MNTSIMSLPSPSTDYFALYCAVHAQRPLSDFDWRIAMEAAEEVLATQPDDVINTPEVRLFHCYHLALSYMA
jgi:hypothetical protein